MAVPHEINPARFLRLIGAPDCAVVVDISINAVGLSCQYRRDLQQSEAEMTIHDALCRWARDGANETHDWPGGRTA